jgi:hypothetical protein
MDFIFDYNCDIVDITIIINFVVTNKYLNYSYFVEHQLFDCQHLFDYFFEDFEMSIIQFKV